MARLRRIVPVGAAILLLGVSSSLCQTLDADTKFRLAQGLERAGELERAAQMYGELYLRNPSSPVLFDALQRVLVQLKHYDDAIALVRDRLSANPSDVALRGALGSVEYKAGREQEAYQEWDSILADNPKNVNVYRMLAGEMIENRLLDRAAEVYHRGRAASGDSSLFCLELAQLLVASMDYSGATNEYLRWLDRNPAQTGFVQNRMAAFSAKPDGRAAAIQAVQEALHEREDARRYELLGWLYLEGNEFDRAFTVYRTLDKLANRQGGALYEFAERAYKAGAFEVAARAYQEAIDAPMPKARIPYAMYGYATSLKDLGLQSDSVRGPFMNLAAQGQESTPVLDRAIAAFREIIGAFPHTEFSAKSWYQIGTLESDRFNALDGALASLGRAEQELQGVNVIRQQILLKIGEILILKGDTARAAQRFKNVAADPGATPDQIDEANFRLAELDYFVAHFDAAADRLASISLNLTANYANDALELEAFLTENRSSVPAALQEYAHASFLARQRKNSEAISVFRHVADTYPTAPLADDALMSAAMLLAKSGMFNDAVVLYGRVLTQFKEHGTLLDRAEFRIGEIYQYGLRDVPKALEAYEKLLVDFPRSIFAEESRNRIRQLRGEA